MGDHIVGEAHAAAPAAHRTAWRLWFASPAVQTVAMLMPATAGFAILLVAKGGDARFTASGEFFVWSAPVAVAVWVAMSLGLLQTVDELRGLFGNQGPAIPVPGLFGLYALYAAVLFAVLTLGGRGPVLPLDQFTLRTLTILAIGLATAAPAVVTLWLVAERLRQLRLLLAADPPLPNAGSVRRSYGRCGSARCGRWLRLA